MRRSRRASAIAGVLLFVSTAEAAPPAGEGSFVLTANSPGGTYAPTFTGNGMLGVRVPPSGQGYAAGTVPAQSELAGFYGQVSGDPKPANDVQQRANIPTWSTLTFSGENGNTFAVPGAGVSRLAAIDRPSHRDRHHDGAVDRARRARHRPHLRGADRPRQPVRSVSSASSSRRNGRASATVTDAIDGTADTTATPELTTSGDEGLERRGASGLGHARDQGHGDPGHAGEPAAGQSERPSDDHADRPDHRSERRPAARVPGAVGSDIHDHQVRRRRELPGHGGHKTAAQTARRRPRPAPAGTRCWRPTRARGRRCGAAGSRCAATARSRPTSTPASSTYGRARATASTGASRRPACRPTATTVTSSGTPRRGCTRRCSRSTPTWPPA